MSTVLGAIYGILGTTLFVVMVGAVGFMFYIVVSSKNNKLFLITNITGGKYSYEYRRGRIENHKSMGRVYYIPSKVKEGLQYAPIFGSQYEYPTHKNKLNAVVLFCDGQKYVPAEFAHTKKSSIEHLVKVEKIINIKGKEKKVEDYEVQKTEVEKPIMMPISADLTSFYLREQEAVLQETSKKENWFAKYGNQIMFMGSLMAAVTVFGIAVVFAYQIIKDGGNSAPDWVRSFVAATEAAQAPPQ
jgi:hypothetical protein